MPKTETTKTECPEGSQSNRGGEIANALEWLIIAFILAFVFRAFFMEPYRIPTGSMADTLMGAHFRLRCQQCGYRYNYGLGNYNVSQDSIPKGAVTKHYSRCPSCGFFQPTGGEMPVTNGDRILVLKCIYQFFEPKQWDVVVFKNPLEPEVNYIKRLIGRPGETVEIIDGDVYINGKISRKPHKVQDKLWMPVYDNDYQPVKPNQKYFNKHKWQQPFKIGDSKWKVDQNNPTKFQLDSGTDQTHFLSYDTTIGNSFRATYAYNDITKYSKIPYCSDLMIRLYVSPGDVEGLIGLQLSKYQIQYRAWIDFEGHMIIAKISENQEYVELVRKQIKALAVNKSVLVKFANVDHQLIFQAGSEKLTYDLGRGPDDTGFRKTDVPPQAKIFGSGKLIISHTAIFRDIHYTSKELTNGFYLGIGIEGNPLKLGKDEFFVLGDNSPASLDGRWWSTKGIGNKGTRYKQGIVPHEYIVGKAMVVYWPGGFKPFARSRFAIMPNFGQMRFIYGGSENKL